MIDRVYQGQAFAPTATSLNQIIDSTNYVNSSLRKINGQQTSSQKQFSIINIETEATDRAYYPVAFGKYPLTNSFGDIDGVPSFQKGGEDFAILQETPSIDGEMIKAIADGVVKTFINIPEGISPSTANFAMPNGNNVAFTLTEIPTKYKVLWLKQNTGTDVECVIEISYVPKLYKQGGLSFKHSQMCQKSEYNDNINLCIGTFEYVDGEDIDSIGNNGIKIRTDNVVSIVMANEEEVPEPEEGGEPQSIFAKGMGLATYNIDECLAIKQKGLGILLQDGCLLPHTSLIGNENGLRLSSNGINIEKSGIQQLGASGLTETSGILVDSGLYQINVDGVTTQINSDNQLVAIGSGKTYTGIIPINVDNVNNKVSLKYKYCQGLRIHGDELEIFYDNNRIRYNQTSGLTTKDIQGTFGVGVIEEADHFCVYLDTQDLSALCIDPLNRVAVNVDGVTTKINNNNQLVAIGGVEYYGNLPIHVNPLDNSINLIYSTSRGLELYDDGLGVKVDSGTMGYTSHGKLYAKNTGGNYTGCLAIYVENINRTIQLRTAYWSCGLFQDDYNGLSLCIGEGLTESSGCLRVNVDNSSITFNTNGELQATSCVNLISNDGLYKNASGCLGLCVGTSSNRTLATTRTGAYVRLDGNSGLSTSALGVSLLRDTASMQVSSGRLGVYVNNSAGIEKTTSGLGIKVDGSTVYINNNGCLSTIGGGGGGGYEYNYDSYNAYRFSPYHQDTPFHFAHPVMLVLTTEYDSIYSKEAYLSLFSACAYNEIASLRKILCSSGYMTSTDTMTIPVGRGYPLCFFACGSWAVTAYPLKGNSTPYPSFSY